MTIRRSTRCGADGIGLSVLEAGPAEGPPTILLHGFPEDALSWRTQIDRLAGAGLRILAPDQRGYGASDRLKEIRAYTLDRLSADILALADGFGVRRFHLVGHDWGGVVAWWLATHEPERIERLVILNAPHPGAMGAYLRRSPLQMLRSSYILTFQPPGLPEATLGAAGFSILKRVLDRSSRPGAFSRAEMARLAAAWGAPGAMTAMLNWYRALRFAPILRDMPRVQAPTLILWGSRDAFLQPGLAAAAAAMCGRARLIRLEEAGHWLQHEEPERVATLIRDFLAEANPPQSTLSGSP